MKNSRMNYVEDFEGNMKLQLELENQCLKSILINFKLNIFITNIPICNGIFLEFLKGLKTLSFGKIKFFVFYLELILVNSIKLKNPGRNARDRLDKSQK